MYADRRVYVRSASRTDVNYSILCLVGETQNGDETRRLSNECRSEQLIW